MARGISETAFATQVEDLLKIFGWRWTHFRPAWSAKGYRTPIKGDKGFPDYCCVRPPRLIFAELKDAYAKPTPEQEAWLEDLKECVKQISLEPIERKGKPIADGWAGIEHLMPSLEVYLWRPDMIDEIAKILK